jgi:hypothetical protein
MAAKYFDVCFGTVVQVDEDQEEKMIVEAVKAAIQQATESPNATVLVGEHKGTIWGQSMDTVVRLRDFRWTKIPAAHTGISQNPQEANNGQR